MVQAKNNEARRTILITRFSAVGDIAMTIPLLYSLADTYPMHRFVLVSRERFGQFLINAPRNLEFAGVKLEKYSGIFGLHRLYKELKAKYRPDTVADLHDVLRTKILRTFFWLGGAETFHIDKGRMEKRRLTRSNNKCLDRLPTTFERYRKVFTQAGLPFTPQFVSLFANGEKGNIEEFASFLPKKGDKKWIGIAPFAKHNGKIYPIHLMSKVVETLSRNSETEIFCFGNGEQEEAVVNEWCKKFANVHSFIGRTNFNGELRLISNLDIMLSMDSANMHMASLVNTPVVSIWGATSPLAGFLGWNQQEADCIQLPLECRPCSIFGNKKCSFGDYRCLNIPPEEVAKRVSAKLQKKPN